MSQCHKSDVVRKFSIKTEVEKHIPCLHKRIHIPNSDFSSNFYAWILAPRPFSVKAYWHLDILSYKAAKLGPYSHWLLWTSQNQQQAQFQSGRLPRWSSSFVLPLWLVVLWWVMEDLSNVFNEIAIPEIYCHLFISNARQFWLYISFCCPVKISLISASSPVTFFFYLIWFLLPLFNRVFISLYYWYSLNILIQHY